MYKTFFTIALALIMQYSRGQAELVADFDAAVRQMESGNYIPAIGTFTDLADKAMDVEFKKFCYIYRALSYNGLGEYEKAIADFDLAIELDPGDLTVYSDRAETKAFIKDLEGAKKDFLFILENDSLSAPAQTALYHMGRIEFQSGHFEAAIHYYDRLIALTPFEADLYYNRGTAKGMLMNIEGAIADYDKAIELKPDYMKAYANRGAAKINAISLRGNSSPSEEETADGCADLKRARLLGDNTVDGMIAAYCQHD